MSETPVPEMVHRMAEAMFDRFQQCVAHNFKRWKDWTPQAFSEAEPEVRAYYVASAQAGLGMLREPTDEMIWAGGTALHDAQEDSAGIYRAMIDAALSSPAAAEEG